MIIGMRVDTRLVGDVAPPGGLRDANAHTNLHKYVQTSMKTSQSRQNCRNFSLLE
jgi:hypothetical protein